MLSMHLSEDAAENKFTFILDIHVFGVPKRLLLRNPAARYHV